MAYQIKHANLLKGVVDLHLHVAPSLMNRYMDIAEMAKRATQYGYKAIVQKDHHSMTSANASLLKKHMFADDDLQILGAIVLNNATGGLRKENVQAAIGFGTKVIWLPTVSARNHIDFVANSGKFPKLAHGITIDETPIPLVDEKGRCRKEIIDILEIVRLHPNILIGTGHGDHLEINAVVEQASEMGMANRLMIDHPTFMVNATMEEVAHWVELGCYIEHIAAQSAPYSAPHHRSLPIEKVLEMIKIAGPEQTILSSDFGQGDNGDPVEGLDSFFDILLKKGITEDEIVMMSNTNPSKLLGLNDSDLIK